MAMEIFTTASWGSRYFESRVGITGGVDIMTDIIQFSAKAADYKARVERLMAEPTYPNEAALFETADTRKRTDGSRWRFWRS